MKIKFEKFEFIIQKFQNQIVLEITYQDEDLIAKDGRIIHHFEAPSRDYIDITSAGGPELTNYTFYLFGTSGVNDWSLCYYPNSAYDDNTPIDRYYEKLLRSVFAWMEKIDSKLLSVTP